MKEYRIVEQDEERQEDEVIADQITLSLLMKKGDDGELAWENGRLVFRPRN